MSKKDERLKPERIIQYVTSSFLSRTVHRHISVIEKWTEEGYLEVAKIDIDGDKLYDKEVAFKKIKNLLKWYHKGFTPEELKAKIDSAIKHTHRWGDDYEPIIERIY